MKNLHLIIILLIFTSTGVVRSQNLTQTIRGTITDEVTGFPLIGANIILVGSNPPVGTVTDVNGVFELKGVPVGRQSIEISYIGYEPRRVDNLMLTSAKEAVIEVSLVEKVTQLDAITVKAHERKDIPQNEMAMVSSRSFTVEETERYAGSLGDPARMVANYAGVMTQNDSRNDIIIRGNSPIGVLWRLEGIEIPNPNHFGALGTTGGPVSMLNNNLLTNSDFLTGAFPAEFGNAIAGVFDLNMRSGNNQVREYTGQIGFNGFELGAEGPFNKNKTGLKASYLANFRYSTLDVMHKLGINFGTGEAIPEYKDLTFLLDFPGRKYGRFKLVGLLGDSYIELGREAGDTANNLYTYRGMATNFGSGLGVIGLSHVYFINPDARFKTTVSYQKTYSSTKLDSLKDLQSVVVPFYRSEESESKISFSTQFRQKLSAKDNFSVGIILDNFYINYLDSVNLAKNHGFVTTADENGTMALYRGYGQWQHKLNDKVTTYAGIYFQHFTMKGENALEPRLSLKWNLRPNQTLSFGFGKHSQLQPKIVYYYQDHDSVTDTYTRTNQNIKFTRSDHFIIGYDYLINKDFRIKVESYYQRLYHIPVKESFPEFSMINAGDFFAIPNEDSLVNRGNGRNYGLELTVEKFLSKGYYFLFTASLFDSKYKGYDGVLRNTAFNGNYVFNLLGGYEYNLGKNMMLTFDLKTVWAGGRRYVPIDVQQSLAEHDEIRDWSRAFTNKCNDYFRTDVRIGFKVNSRKVSQEWAVDLQNITGFQSLFMEGIDINKGEKYKVYQQGFFPMVLYRIQF